MVMKDQEIIDSIILGLEKSQKVSFRGNDLLDTFFIAKDITYPEYHMYHIYQGEEKIIPRLIQTDYRRFIQELTKDLSEKGIPFILRPNDSLDIFANRDIYNDYVKVYTLQGEIDNLDTITSDQKSSDEDKISSLEKMYELYNQERDILEKYGE